ncbi:MAG: nucleotidyltransferase domain-containing protein [Candidatus Aenigmarchaeota archaeon]|nr:nucleotidyltransferase domain-containing protein [Candidatus Aenigmarchaeota archaeon]
MKFRNFAEGLLGSKVKVKVIMYMLSENVPTSEREVARILNVSHMAVNKVMKDFHDFNIITPFKIGNVISWKLNERSYAYEAVTNIKHMAKWPPLEDLKAKIRSKLSGYALKRVAIFGSVAEGREEPDSDIDLLVITEDEKQKKEVVRALAGFSDDCIQRYGNRLSPFVLTEEEIKKTAKRRMVKGAEKGIVVI